MKTLLTISLVFLSLTLSGQQPKAEILLVGTQHSFRDSLMDRQNFERIQDKLVAFRPDIICIESVPVSDAASLREVRSSQLGTAEKLRAEKGLNRFYLGREIKELRNTLMGNPDDLVTRSKLANHLYASHDFWNAYYQYYQLAKALQDEDLSDVDELRESFALDSMHARIYGKQRKGEYVNIVFPTAKKLGIDHFDNIDYRAEEEEFLKRTKRAAIGTIFNLKVFKLKKAFKQMEEQMLQAEREGALMDHINSADMRETYVDLIDNSSRFLKSKNMRKVVELWEWRNQIMAERIIQKAIDSDASRVLVTFGAFHVPFVKRYLEQYPEIKVITYDQLPVEQLITQNQKQQ